LSFNGLSFNGFSFNGLSFNGPVFSGVNGSSLSIFVEGSQIKGVLQPGNRQLSGADFEGMTLTANYENADKEKGTITFRIDDAHLDKTTSFTDIWNYRVSAAVNGSKQRHPICFDEQGQATDLVFLAGMSWDFQTGNRTDNAKTFTLACKDGVLQKCAHLGYRPWATASQCQGSGKRKRCTQLPLKDHHQACTRMLRADYCGNGKSWTLDGTLLDIFDYLQPPIQLREENWQIEARWVPTGAMCLTEERHPELGYPGYCVNDGNKTRLPKCNPYEDNRGLIVSTFNDDPKHRRD
jgi:hypothetical protein